MKKNILFFSFLLLMTSGTQQSSDLDKPSQDYKTSKKTKDFPKTTESSTPNNLSRKRQRSD